MKKIKILGVVATAVAVMTSSCEYFELEGGLDELTTAEIVSGLQRALEIGTDSATGALAVTNGYYKGTEKFVKIPLPEEAQDIREIINNNETLRNAADLIDLDGYFEDVIKSVNRAAENAANDAGPIFKDAILNMSFTDAVDILNGHVPSSSSIDYDSTAATQYFKQTTTGDLTDLFAPHINNALGEDLGLGFSASTAWAELTSEYNKYRNDPIVKGTLLFLPSIDLPTEINDDLGAFCTEKALDGLYYKVGLEEKKIRRNPFKWADDIIRKVFGSLQE